MDGSGKYQGQHIQISAKSKNLPLHPDEYYSLGVLTKELTRKEFLGMLAAFLGLFILHGLSLGGSAVLRQRHDPLPYGHNAYGGKQKG